MSDLNVLSYFFLFLVGVSKGVCDLIQFKFDKSIFNGLNDIFWNPKKSWCNKWKWYYVYKDNYPITKRKEKFWGSSRWFVFITDAWHLFQFFLIKFIFLAIFFHNGFQLLDFIGVLSLYLGFWITYENPYFNYTKSSFFKSN